MCDYIEPHLSPIKTLNVDEAIAYLGEELDADDIQDWLRNGTLIAAEDGRLVLASLTALKAQRVAINERLQSLEKATAELERAVMSGEATFPVSLDEPLDRPRSILSRRSPDAEEVDVMLSQPQIPTGMACEKVGVFFVQGNSILEAKLMDLSEIPKPGAELVLKERSIHTRGHEHCTRPCCVNTPETTRKFEVFGVCKFESDEALPNWPSALSQMVQDRQWDETVCKDHELCAMFDSYSLASYLGLDGRWEEPHFAFLVDVEPVCEGR